MLRTPALSTFALILCAACGGQPSESRTETSDALGARPVFTRSKPPVLSTRNPPARCRASATLPAGGALVSAPPSFHGSVHGDCSARRVVFAFNASFVAQRASAWTAAASSAAIAFSAGEWDDVLYQALRDGHRTIHWKVEGRRASGAIVSSAVRWFSLASAYVARDGTRGLRYDDVRAKSAHNAYERDEGIIDQLLYHRIRSIELDIHHSKSGHPRLSGNWYVFHDSRIPGGRSTTCNRFSDCLVQLRSFQRLVPNHEVITLFVDLKDGFRTGQTAVQFDQLIRQTFERSGLFTPAALATDCASARTLQDTVTGDCRWPRLGDVRGKIMVVLTGPASKLDGYLDGTDRDRVAFVARGIERAGEMSRHPQTIFFNLHADDRFIAAQIKDAGFVSRVYFLDQHTFDGALGLGIHHLGVNQVNSLRHANVRTHNDHGYPFSCFDVSCANLQEDEAVIGIQVASGDIWDDEDSFHFVKRFYSDAGATWTAAVSSPNSDVEAWAKGCLMARAGTSDGAPYFAVCRPADEHRVRVQWREGQDDDTRRTEERFVPKDTVDPESLVHLKLTVWSAGSRDCAAGWTSIDGVTWHQIGANRCFASRLRHQGLAASSHDPDRSIRFLFADVKRNGAPQSLSTLTTHVQIHSGAGAAFSGSL